MTRALVFETPGLIDLKSLTMMGVSAKPNTTNPIGQFGTGLKYACAALTRLGTPPVIWVGRNRYEFTTRRDEFRGSEVEVIDLIGPHDRRELPYTTGYGAFWEPWMIYRELEANTVDEGGRTYIADDSGYTNGASFDPVMGAAERTRIAVYSELLIACHEARDEVFLPNATRERGPLSSAPEVEVFEAPSRHLYYRGLRVYTLPKPARRTYNLLAETALTEDRTLKEPWLAEFRLKQHVAATDDEKLVLDVLHATKDEYESEMVFYDSLTPSETVVRVTSEQATATGGVSAHTPLGRFVGAHLLKTAPRVDPFERWPRPWRVDGDSPFTKFIRDANDRPVMVTTFVSDDAIELLDLVVALVNRDAPTRDAAWTPEDEEVPF